MTHLEAGRHRTAIAVPALTLFLGALAPSSVAQCELQKLLPADVTVADEFGNAVAIDGDTLLVGAHLTREAGFSSGVVYVFVQSGFGWTQQAKLVPSDPRLSMAFGCSVSLAGDTAVVGAWGDYPHGPQSGSAYVFVRQNTTWIQQAKLLPGDGAPLDRFGRDVSISARTVVVGAPGDEDNGPKSGSAYVFVRSGGAWSQEAKLLPGDGQQEDHFGMAVGLSGDTAVVGAPRYVVNPGSGSGSAYVFVRSGTAWTQQAKLLPVPATPKLFFGRDVGASGETIVVGVPWDDAPGENSGSACVFVRSGTTWSQQGKLVASDGAPFDYFGSDVSLEGDRIAVGAYYDDDNGPYSGSAYSFVRSGSTWNQQAKLLPHDGETWDIFGDAVATEGDITVVGARWNDDHGGDSGSAYVFSTGPPMVYGAAKVNSQACTPSIAASGLASLSDPGPFDVAATEVINNKNGQLFYGLGGRAAIPFYGGTFLVAAPIQRTLVQDSGGNPPPDDCSGFYSFDFNAWAQGGQDPNLGAGAVVDAQYWYRDRADPTGYGLTDAIEFTLCP